ncbi:sulfite exporter TauE/SafE family protein [Pelobacter seleniigenes]|uniref:sulfite exporter TauE/SafE family protein n=1 Tax=Pelobacter seleniigenes TaxID=407188 RepID=UPI0004A71508|nr:sulfite exporter TauE/SafE family protein [Pelobacter seleniigenes]
MDTSILIFIAGLLAGFMNSVAGGGSFITFPTLIFAGVPSVSANATSTVALFPGSIAGAWAYRRECTSFTAAPLKAMILTSLTGGLLGALLLQLTPTPLFDKAIPWLLATGTVIFAAGPKLGWLMQQKRQGQSAALLAAQLLLGIYGGYFGGAVGIMMMAVWSLFGILDIRVMNGIKTLLVGVTNAAAVLWFSAMGMVWWPQALIMLAGAVIGGYSGARCARHLNPIFLRRGITLFNIIITAYFFLKMMR